MYRFIFLDVDGVMVTNSSLANSPDKHMRSFDKRCVDNLNLLIRRTNASLILSSNWKSLMSLAQFNIHAKREGVEYEVIDNTPVLYFEEKLENLLKITSLESVREQEIMAFVDFFKTRGNVNFVVFDDLDLKVPNFIRTEVEDGLTIEHINKAIQILGDK